MCNTMRTSILSAAILGLFAAGCAGELSGTGDDTQPGPNCGNGTMDTGEACDDGNTLSGDGCSATCTTEQTTSPRVAITVDKPTLMTDLAVPNEVTVTLTSMNGFAGDVTLTTSVVDSAQAPITNWTTTLSTTTVTVGADMAEIAKVTLSVPGDSVPLNGMVKVTATSTAGTADAAIAVTANPILRFTYTTVVGGYQCVISPTNPTTLRLKVNRTLKVVNDSDPAGTGCGGGPCRMRIHFDANGAAGIAHQGASMAPGASYDQTPTTSTTGANFYCHTDAAVTNQAIEGTGVLRQRVVIVD
jgi:cysteine-rich repeat protein